MALEEQIFHIPSEHEQNVCGQFDAYLKKIERTTGATVNLKLVGNEEQVRKAGRVLSELAELSKRGNQITEQNVDYALALAMDQEGESGALLSRFLS